MGHHGYPKPAFTHAANIQQTHTCSHLYVHSTSQVTSVRHTIILLHAALCFEAPKKPPVSIARRTDPSLIPFASRRASDTARFLTTLSIRSTKPGARLHTINSSYNGCLQATEMLAFYLIFIFPWWKTREEGFSWASLDFGVYSGD